MKLNLPITKTFCFYRGSHVMKTISVLKSISLGILIIMPLGAATPTAKTFFKPSNAPVWHTTDLLPFQHAPALPSGIVSALSIEGFYWKSMDKKKLGSYFGFYDDATATTYPFVRVTADTSLPSSLLPQDIVHNAALADNPTDTTLNRLKSTINFNPSIEQYGVITTNSVAIHDWLIIHTIMPWTHTTHHLGMVISNNTNTTVEGATKSVLDFFNGDLAQEEAESKNQQDALCYGKLTQRQSATGLADITLLILFAPTLTSNANVRLGVLATLPTTSRAQGIYLFEPTLGTGGHPLFGLHATGDTNLFTVAAISVGAFGHATLRAGLSTQEVRTPSFLILYDEGVDAQWGRYALAGKQNARRLFPLVNMLTQVVSVKPGTCAECTVGLSASYKKISLLSEYRYTYTSREQVSPAQSWSSDAFALSRLDYAQTTLDGEGHATAYNTFNIPTNSTLLDHAVLPEHALAFDAAATPAQSIHTLSFTLKATPLPRFPQSTIHVRGHYSFGSKELFGIGGYGISCGISHTF